MKKYISYLKKIFFFLEIWIDHGRNQLWNITMHFHINNLNQILFFYINRFLDIDFIKKYINIVKIVLFILI